MKKTLLLAFALLFVSALSLNAQKKLAYITDTLATGTSAFYTRDSLILPMFKKDANFVVTKIQSTVALPDLSGYDLIVLSEPPGSTSTSVTSLKGYNKPMLNMKTFAYKTATGAWSWAATASCVDNPSAVSVIINHANHPILTGFNLLKGDSLQILSKVSTAMNAATTYKGLNGVTSFTSVTSTVGATLDTIAVIKGAATGQLCVLEMPVGLNMNGTTLTSKLVHIGINSASYGNLTAQGLKLVKNAAYYLAGLTISTGTRSVSATTPVTQTADALIIGTQSSMDLTIYSASGQRVGKAVGNSISTSGLNKGVYILKMTNGNGANETFKFIK